MSVSADDFREALGRWASGVTVVTCSSEGKPHGMTVSAFSSVSLDPPLVSVCLAREARTLTHITSNGRFAVNVLAEEQAHLSNSFASRDDETERFDNVSYDLGDHGVPLLAGALAQIECQVTAQHEIGDHTLVVGRVVSTRVFEKTPLIYYSGNYGAFASE